MLLNKIPASTINFLNDDFKRSTKYPRSSSLMESRLAYYTCSIRIYFHVIKENLLILLPSQIANEHYFPYIIVKTNDLKSNRQFRYWRWVI